MTIKEVEQLLEVPRATVRFYEKEGLIKPTREENGYRDYSEEDVERLRKIIIFRKIGLPVEDIEDLFDGVKSIETVLAENSINLQKQMDELAGAMNLCNKMKTEVVNLDSFDTEKYWNYVEEEERKGNRFADIAKDFVNEEKKIVSRYIGWTDSEGNLYDIKKSTINWIISLIVIGIIFCIVNHGFNIENFSKGVGTIFCIMFCEMIISIPVILLGKKYPWIAKNRIKALIITGGILFAGVLSLSGCSAKPVTGVVEVVEESTETVPSEDMQTESVEEQSQEPGPLEIQSKEIPPVEALPSTVTIIMVGDVLLHTRVEQSAITEDGSFDFAPIFANVKEEVAAADLALVNQEVIIGGEELGISGYPAFNAPYEVADELVDTGFDVICHATNHALDKGKKGLTNCLNYWQENHPDIAVLGIHDSKGDQEEIYVAECNGMRIAILNYTYGTNGIPLPGDMPYAVDLLKESRVMEDLQRAEEMADFIVVCPHWGTEYSLKKTAEQDKWVKIFYEGGADLVLGTHPHVIEPVEMIEGEKGPMLVYYSLGNFVNWTSGTGGGVANRMAGGMAKVTLIREQDKVVISEYDMLPLVTHVSPGYGEVTTYFLEDYSKELADENAIRNQDENFNYEYVEQLFRNVLEAE